MSTGNIFDWVESTSENEPLGKRSQGSVPIWKILLGNHPLGTLRLGKGPWEKGISLFGLNKRNIICEIMM